MGDCGDIEEERVVNPRSELQETTAVRDSVLYPTAATSGSLRVWQSSMSRHLEECRGSI
jgi:hypothetical protein